MHRESMSLFQWKAVMLLMSFIFAISGTANAQEKRNVTLLAMGDSITAGSKEYTCYREILVPAMRAKGWAFEFLGPNNDKVSAHAGYSGKNAAFLRSKAKQLYSAYPADIVMLHSGHNNFAKDKPVAGIIRDTEALIETFREINPKVTVLLAKVIPAGKLPKYSYIPELNQALVGLQKKLSAKGRQVVLVDMSKGFDWKTDTIKDKVHPNALGAKKMADQWMRALTPFFNVQGKNGGGGEHQPFQLRLWAGAAPGVKTTQPTQRQLAKGRVDRVSVPTMDVYRPARPNGTTLIICSGGGYKKLASGPLGKAAADLFLPHGYTVCSLKYRLSPPSNDVVKDAQTDGARAVKIVRSRAQQWGLDPSRVGMIGFSAENATSKLKP